MSKPDYSVPNAYCAALPENIKWDSFPFGETVLIGKDEYATERARAEGDAVDMYAVKHSGFIHCWSSSVVMASLVATGLDVKTSSKGYWVLCYTNSFGEYMELRHDDRESDSAKCDFHWRSQTAGYSDVHWEYEVVETRITRIKVRN